MDEKTYGTEKLPLEHFAGMTREQIEAVDGIGPKTAGEILAALGVVEVAATPEPTPPAMATLVEGGVVTQVRVPGGTY